MSIHDRLFPVGSRPPICHTLDSLEAYNSRTRQALEPIWEGSADPVIIGLDPVCLEEINRPQAEDPALPPLPDIRTISLVAGIDFIFNATKRAKNQDDRVERLSGILNNSGTERWIEMIINRHRKAQVLVGRILKETPLLKATIYPLDKTYQL